jgi:hypothetical protein
MALFIVRAIVYWNSFIFLCGVFDENFAMVCILVLGALDLWRWTANGGKD